MNKFRHVFSLFIILLIPVSFYSQSSSDVNISGSVAPDKTIYKLVMIADEPPRFYINSQSIPVHKWEPYQELINKLKKELKKKNQD